MTTPNTTCSLTSAEETVAPWFRPLTFVTAFGWTCVFVLSLNGLTSAWRHSAVYLLWSALFLLGAIATWASIGYPAPRPAWLREGLRLATGIMCPWMVGVCLFFCFLPYCGQERYLYIAFAFLNGWVVWDRWHRPRAPVAPDSTTDMGMAAVGGALLLIAVSWVFALGRPEWMSAIWGGGPDQLTGALRLPGLPPIPHSDLFIIFAILANGAAAAGVASYRPWGRRLAAWAVGLQVLALAMCNWAALAPSQLANHGDASYYIEEFAFQLVIWVAVAATICFVLTLPKTDAAFRGE